MNEKEREKLDLVGQGVLQIGTTIMMAFAQDRFASITKREIAMKLRHLADKLQEIGD